MTTINPYINFNGTCEEAFNLYKSIFGGEFTVMQRFNEMPDDVPEEHKPSESEGEKIMHVTLPIGKHAILMGSDYPEKTDNIQAGNNFSISVDTSSEDEADKYFNELSKGGKVIMPMDKTFWGSLFGMLVDKFGIQWMVSYTIENN